MPELVAPLQANFMVSVGDIASPQLIQRWEALRALVNSLVPTGTISATLDSVEPEGWLFLNGQFVSKTRHSKLFAMVGTTHGSTETTFALPDLRDRLVIGANTIALGALGGANAITLTVDQLPAHAHGMAESGHTHNLTIGDGTAGSTAVEVSGGDVGTLSTSTVASGVGTGSTGGGGAIDITPASFAGNMMVRA